MPWSSRFSLPIVAPGHRLVTLADAQTYMLALPADQQRTQHWQVAAETVLSAAEFGGWLWMDFARVSMTRALKRPASCR